jgi:ATP-dependent Lon protease
MVAEHQQERTKLLTKVTIPADLPLIPVGENMVFPSIVVPLATQEKKVVQLIDAALSNNKVVGVFGQRTDAEQPTSANLYAIGSAALIARMFKIPDGSVRVFLQGLARIRLVEITQNKPYLKGRVEVVEEKLEKTT